MRRRAQPRRRLYALPGLSGGTTTATALRHLVDIGLTPLQAMQKWMAEFEASGKATLLVRAVLLVGGALAVETTGEFTAIAKGYVRPPRQEGEARGAAKPTREASKSWWRS